jgi:hypothetical protein
LNCPPFCEDQTSLAVAKPDKRVKEQQKPWAYQAMVQQKYDIG